ncbi:ACP S-malonyltransferase [Sporobolomyces salmoneus]|uniref:ACP S-malonyltransferase n=1 Tax=Sporobolomyces salmoneus TaxID=183962 RepID=UPI003172C0DF
MMRPVLSCRPTLVSSSSSTGSRRCASHFPSTSSSSSSNSSPPSSLPSSTSSQPPPPPPPPSTLYTPSPTPSTSTSGENPTWSDPSYLARYRNPTSRLNHDVSHNFITSNGNGNGKAQRSRRNRIANDALWSGGEASPPIPLESHRSAAQQSSSSASRPKHALLFPGSGSQYVGMGLFLKEKGKGKEVWSEAEDALSGFEEWRKGLRLDQLEGEVGELGKMLDQSERERRKEAKMQQIVFDGPQDELTRSSNAQPAILITSIAFLRTLQSQLSSSSVVDSSSLVLGHSSGEYSAAVASGAISFSDGVRLTRLHGLLTHYALSLRSIGLSPELDAPNDRRGQMSALVLNPGRTHAEVTEIVRKVRAKRSSSSRDGGNQEGTVEVASFNSSSQVVLAGSRDGILRASEWLKEEEIASRAADLPVSAPFHCSFMKPAAGGMHHALTCGAIKLSTPSVPLVSGFDASLLTSPSTLVSNLVDQISLPVRWSTCINTLPTLHGIRRLVFLGPGQALANLARRDHKLLKEARREATGQNSKEEELETEVVSVATEKDMERLVRIWNDEVKENARQ